jgi:streptomycin 6-kinase
VEQGEGSSRAGDRVVDVSHPGLAWATASAAGRAWLARLPRLVGECVERWSLVIGKPFPYAHASLAVPATTADGADAVLKVCFPHRESEHEADALARWAGNGAVRLLAHDRERWALLLERCRPGTHLSVLAADAALDVVIGLLPRLWVASDEPFRPLADEAAWWSSYLVERWEGAGRPFERTLLDAALEALRVLPPSQGEQVLVHQDLHADNVLRAQREPWLVIDPKPLVGEREFGVAPLVRGSELGHGRRHVEHRLDRLTGELGLDRERARLWTLAQTVAWISDGGHVRRHVETARWLLRAQVRRSARLGR